MPTEFLPIIYPEDGTVYGHDEESEEGLFNCTPWILNNGQIGACPRAKFTSDPAAINTKGRGLATFQGNPTDLKLDDSTFYYDGGNQDLKATTGQGYLGNTGFNEDYTGCFVEHLLSGTPNLVIVNAGHTSTHASAEHGNIWYTSDITSAPSSVDDAQLPCNAGVSMTRGGASLDGYFFVADITGKIYNSDLNSLTAWSGDFLTAEKEPDVGIYCGKHHDHVVYIGTRSIEFFYNAGNASGSPLAPRQDISYNIGCYYPNAISEVGDVIYFIGTEKGSTWPRVYKLENFQLTVLSNNLIEGRMLDLYGTFPDITTLDPMKAENILTYVALHKSPGLVLTGASPAYGSPSYGPAFSYYYHMPSGKWARWSYGTDSVTGGGLVGTSDFALTLPIVAFNGAGSVANTQYQFTNGAVTTEFFSGPATDGNAQGGAITYMKFPRWDAGTDRKKRINWVRVATAPIGDQLAATKDITATLRWLDYDREVAYQTVPDNYSAGKSVALNTRGSRLARLGTSRSRSFLLEFDSNGPASIVKGLEIDYEIVGE